MENKVLKNKAANNKNLKTEIILAIALLLLFVVFTCLSKYFLTFKNISNLLQHLSVLGIASCGVIFVILSGGLDLSTGSTAALVAIYAARLVEVTGMWWVGMLGGVVLSFVCGVINGLLITRAKINPLITTLGTMTIFRGVAYLENDSQSIPIFDDSFKQLGQGRVLQVPIAVILMVLIFVATWFVLKYTSFGRKVFSVGGNAQAAYYAGIDIRKTRFWIYVLAAVLAGVAGVCSASITGAGSPNSQTELAMDGISAVILGGAALSGGKGSLVGTLIGVLILGTITNGLTLLNTSPYWQLIIKGVILLVAVGMDVVKGQGAFE